MQLIHADRNTVHTAWPQVGSEQSDTAQVQESGGKKGGQYDLCVLQLTQKSQREQCANTD